MRRRLSITLLSTAVGLALLSVFAGPAEASDPVKCEQTNRFTNSCLVQAIEPSTPSRPVTDISTGEDPGSDESVDKKPSGATGPGSPCIWKAEAWYSAGDSTPVPCTSEHGVWSNEWNCYVSTAPVDPQPPTTAPEWDGHSPGDGAIYGCYNVAGGLRGTMWLAEPPDATDAGPTPGEVAQIAVERMNLRAIEIGMSPDPNGPGVVALPTWLWVENPGEQTFGPITRTASAGSVTVTATARVERIVWDMGDGTQVVCTGPGTPYESRSGRSESPDCGHTYTRESGYQPGQEYTVTATSEWVVEWVGAGQSGSLDVDDLSSSVQVSVGEAQVLVN